MASGSSGNKRRVMIQSGPSESRRRRPQFILFQRTWVRQFESLWGLDWSLGEGVGEWETSGKNLASEIAHLQSLTFRGQARPQRRLEVGFGSVDDSNWNFQSSRGQLRGRKGTGHFVPAILILPSQPATACTLQIWNRLVAARSACWWGNVRYSGVLV